MAKQVFSWRGSKIKPKHVFSCHLLKICWVSNGYWVSKWFEPRHDKTNKMRVRPAKTQISLGIRPVWSVSSLSAQWVANDPSFLHADSEYSDQTGRMPRLIWVFAGRTVTLLVLLCRGSFTIVIVVSRQCKFEPPHDKTNKMACAPSKDSDQPGHLLSPIRVFAIRMKKAWVLSYPLSAQRRLWSDWADAQADLSLRWAHSHFVGFVMSRLISIF